MGPFPTDDLAFTPYPPLTPQTFFKKWKFLKIIFFPIFEVSTLNVISGMVFTALNAIKLSLENLGIPQSHWFRKQYVLLAEITHRLESDS